MNFKQWGMLSNSFFLIRLLYLSTFLLSTYCCYSQLPAQQMLSVSYEGGFVTHPGISAGYSHSIYTSKGWTFMIGAKAGFYYHRRYQTAVFLLPGIQIQHTGKSGFLFGANLNFGPQRTFIPNVYETDGNGNIKRNKAAGMVQWVIAPGIRLGKDLSIKSNVPIQWFINPQLQFRNPKVGRNEKYLLMGIGVNYKLR